MLFKDCLVVVRVVVMIIMVGVGVGVGVYRKDGWMDKLGNRNRLQRSDSSTQKKLPRTEFISDAFPAWVPVRCISIKLMSSGKFRASE